MKKIKLTILSLLLALSSFAQVGNYQSVNLNNSGEGATLLTFNIERPWVLKQIGSGASTHLQLHNHAGPNKHFQIKTDGGFHLLNQSNNYNTYLSANGGHSYIGTLGGNLGIGTNSARFPLDIKTNNNGEGNNLYFGDRRFYIAGITGNGNNNQMYGGLVLHNLTSQQSGLRSIDIVVGGNNDFTSNSTPENIVMRIQSNGNVGIGTGSYLADEKLTVKGIIHSEEVKVDLNVPGPDYVFESDYQLLTLQETKKYISENKHLPEIPSAKEMVTNGIELGDMNMLLLKKIEELTLYQIELMEKLEQQNSELQDVKKKLQQMSN
ncbi:hypothetical protein [Reichenbachiella sp.]|uniref:hypothetical protein n=1 Tax=Reichenbachiella sp. TaxID=2184521 RepID=UPI003296D435